LRYLVQVSTNFRPYRKRDASRSLLVAELATASLGLLAGMGFIDVHDHGRLFSSQSPRPRKASGLRVVLSAERLNAAHSVPLEQRHTSDNGQRTVVLPSDPSSSLSDGATKPAAKLFRLEHCMHYPAKTGLGRAILGLNWLFPLFLIRGTRKHAASTKLPRFQESARGLIYLPKIVRPTETEAYLDIQVSCLSGRTPGKKPISGRAMHNHRRSRMCRNRRIWQWSSESLIQQKTKRIQWCYLST